MWLNFLHIYQPPTQKKEIFQDIVCGYRELFSVLEKNKSAKVVLNICGCLTERLAKEGGSDVIQTISSLVARGQIELTATAAFHPILPLLPGQEILRQIELNNRINAKYFGDLFRPQGFFAPEAAYDKKTLKIISDLGYRWIIADEISCFGRLDQLDFKKFYQIKNFDLIVYFASRKTSKTIAFTNPLSPLQFLKLISEKIGKEGFLITALDGETFGHHHRNGRELLEVVYKTDIASVLPKELQPEASVKINFIPASWETHEEDLRQGIFFGLWQHPKNLIQQKLWQLTYEIIRVVRNQPKKFSAQKKLDRALASCTFWWASCFPWWHPEMIKEGMRLLMGAVEAINLQETPKIKEIKGLYLETIRLIDDWHTAKVSQKIIESYDRKILPQLKKCSKNLTLRYN